MTKTVGNIWGLNWFVVKSVEIQSLLQLAAFIITGNETLQLPALLVDAARVLCSLNKPFASQS